MSDRESVAICAGHGRFLCTVGLGHLCEDAAAAEDEPDLCVACEGRGQIVVSGYPFTCELCRGYGRVVEGVPG